jgi:hypothetical protein
MAPAELDTLTYGCHLQEPHILLCSIHGSCSCHCPYIGPSCRSMFGCLTQIVNLDSRLDYIQAQGLASGGGSVLVNFREDTSAWFKNGLVSYHKKIETKHKFP